MITWHTRGYSNKEIVYEKNNHNVSDFQGSDLTGHLKGMCVCVCVCVKPCTSAQGPPISIKIAGKFCFWPGILKTVMNGILSNCFCFFETQESYAYNVSKDFSS